MPPRPVNPRPTLLKYRRGSIASMNWREFRLVLDAIGWKVEETLAVRPIALSARQSWHDHRDVVSAGFADPRALRSSADAKVRKEDPTLITLWNAEDPAYDHMGSGRALHAALASMRRDGPREPMTWKDTWVTEISEPRAKVKKYPASHLSPAVTVQGVEWTMRLATVVKAQKIIAADGDVGLVYGMTSGAPYYEVDAVRIATWMNAHGAMAQVLGRLGVGEHVPGQAGPLDRTLNDTGTCPVCESNVKLTSSRTMVHHGYQRPGYGFIVGDCFGVHKRPWEVSPEGKIAYVNQALVPSLQHHEEYLGRLTRNEVTSFTDKRYNGQDRVTKVGDPGWEHRLEVEIRNEQQIIEQHKREIVRCKKAIDAWKRVLLPDGKEE